MKETIIICGIALIWAYVFGRLFAKGVLHEFNGFIRKTFKQNTQIKSKEDGKEEK